MIIRESTDDEVEDLEAIEGTEDLVAPAPLDDYKDGEEDIDEDIDIDFEELP